MSLLIKVFVCRWALCQRREERKQELSITLMNATFWLLGSQIRNLNISCRKSRWQKSCSLDIDCIISIFHVFLVDIFNYCIWIGKKVRTLTLWKIILFIEIYFYFHFFSEYHFIYLFIDNINWPLALQVIMVPVSLRKETAFGGSTMNKGPRRSIKLNAKEEITKK